MNMAWYAYIGGNRNAITSYFLLAGQPPCLDGSSLCAISAPAGPGNMPANIPLALQAKITLALTNMVAQPQPIPPLQPEVLLKD